MPEAEVKTQEGNLAATKYTLLHSTYNGKVTDDVLRDLLSLSQQLGDGGQAPVPSLKIKNLQNIPSIAA